MPASHPRRQTWRALSSTGVVVLLTLAGFAPPASAAHRNGCRHRSDAYSRAVLADKPVLYYRLDERSGQTLCDSSKSRNNGVYSASGITYGVRGPLASGDKAIAASGAAGVVGQSGSAPAGLTGNHSFTLEAWFKNTEKTAANHVLVDIGQTCTDAVTGESCAGVTITNGQVAGLALYPHQNAQLGWGPTSGFGIDEQGSNYVWDPTTVRINLWNGKWHYLAVTYSHRSGQLTGYVDGHDLGQPDSDPYGNPAFHIAAARVALGQWFSSSYFYPLVGDLDDVAVYATGLGAKRISAHWKAAHMRRTRRR